MLDGVPARKKSISVHSSSHSMALLRLSELSKGGFFNWMKAKCLVRLETRGEWRTRKDAQHSTCVIQSHGSWGLTRQYPQNPISRERNFLLFISFIRFFSQQQKPEALRKVGKNLTMKDCSTIVKRDCHLRSHEHFHNSPPHDARWEREALYMWKALLSSYQAYQVRAGYCAGVHGNSAVCLNDKPCGLVSNYEAGIGEQARPLCCSDVLKLSQHDGMFITEWVTLVWPWSLVMFRDSDDMSALPSCYRRFSRNSSSQTFSTIFP